MLLSTIMDAITCEVKPALSKAEKVPASEAVAWRGDDVVRIVLCGDGLRSWGPTSTTNKCSPGGRWCEAHHNGPDRRFGQGPGMRHSLAPPIAVLGARGAAPTDKFLPRIGAILLPAMRLPARTTVVAFSLTEPIMTFRAMWRARGRALSQVTVRHNWRS